VKVPVAGAALALALALACIPEEGPLMKPGEDCLDCHDGDEAARWTTAGTWAPGSSVTIADSNGKLFTLQTNRVGNFYTAEALRFPLRVTVDGEAMTDSVEYGGCNRCHGEGGEDDDGAATAVAPR
jgi:hypothetical protein